MNTPGPQLQDAHRAVIAHALRQLFVIFTIACALALASPLAAAPKSHTIVRTHKTRRAAMENLQRWVNAGHASWCKDAQLVASAELRRIAPEFSSYPFDLVSLPLEARSHAATRAVFTYTSLDGRTTYRITLRRYRWLLPLAGDLRSIVWAPACAEITTRG